MRDLEEEKKNPPHLPVVLQRTALLVYSSEGIWIIYKYLGGLD